MPDWNDLHVARGLSAVREQINAQLACAANDEELPPAPSEWQPPVPPLAAAPTG